MINLRIPGKKENKDASAAPSEGGAPQSPKKKKKLSRKRIIIIAVVVVLAAFFVIKNVLGSKKTTTVSYSTVAVERRNITQTLSGSGTLQPAASYTVTTLVTGEILNAPIKEGDKVKKGDLLFAIDSTDMASTINRAQITLSNAQTSYQTKLKNMDNLNVKTTVAGTVTNIAVEVGDEVKAGQTIATVVDSETMTLVVPFPSDDAVKFYVGQPVDVTLEGSFEKLKGSVSKVAATDTILTGNIMARNVTIEVKNPGAISNTQTASATIGEAAGCSSATFSYKNTTTVTALVAGTVSKINAPEGSRVSKNQTIVTLTSDTLSNDLKNAANSVQDAQLALENNSTKLKNYNITSPIDGTVVLKNYKQGDNLYDTGLKLCVVYDLSYLQVTMNVDELDIANVKVGQTATITADAISGKSFIGKVTKVSTVGTTTGGVTTYPVTIQIDDFGSLLPSMNVNAKIVVSQSQNVLAVPVNAVARGGRVLVKSGGATATPGESISVASGSTPAGFEYVTVTTGLSDGAYIEIKSGLKESDVIAYTKPTSGTSNFSLFGPRQPAPQQTTQARTSTTGGNVTVTTGGAGGTGGAPGGTGGSAAGGTGAR